MRHHTLLKYVVLRLSGGLRPLLAVVRVEAVGHVARVVRRVRMLLVSRTYLTVAAVLRRVSARQLDAFVDIQTDRGTVGALNCRLFRLLPRAEDFLGPHAAIEGALCLRGIVLVVAEAAVVERLILDGHVHTILHRVWLPRRPRQLTAVADVRGLLDAARRQHRRVAPG